MRYIDGARIINPKGPLMSICTLSFIIGTLVNLSILAVIIRLITISPPDNQDTPTTDMGCVDNEGHEWLIGTHGFRRTCVKCLLVEPTSLNNLHNQEKLHE